MSDIKRTVLILCGVLCPAFAAAAGGGGVIRHWSRFIRTGESGAYVSTTCRDGVIEIWKEARLGTNAFDFGIVVKRGIALTNLGPAEVAFRSAQIDDVFIAGALSSERNFSRMFVDYFPAVGYVALLCTLRGEYRPGQVPLQPALALSVTGKPGTWRYLGHLPGEPTTLTPPGRPHVWSDGGGLVRLDDGRWRVYLNGYGPALTAAEAERLDGPWHFLRDADGRLRELAGALPLREKMRGGCAFPAVLRLSSTEWHLWCGDQWPVQAIWHLWSRDGLTWVLYGEQPEITREAFGASAIKCLRPYHDSDTGNVGGLLSVWEGDETRGRWMLHHALLDSERPEDRRPPVPESGEGNRIVGKP